MSLVLSKLLRIPQANTLACKSKSGFYEAIAKGLLPPAVKVGIRAAAWPEHELQAINRARIAGRSDDDIRALVQKLVADRASLGAV